jgi:hypothetical protein
LIAGDLGRPGPRIQIPPGALLTPPKIVLEVEVAQWAVMITGETCLLWGRWDLIESLCDTNCFIGPLGEERVYGTARAVKG